MEVLLLPLSDGEYALEIARTRQVVSALPVEPLPGAPASVLGVANLRGEVVAVLDTARLLGIEPDRGDHHVLVETGRGPCLLTCGGRPRTGVLGDPVGATRVRAARGRYAAADGTEAILLDLEALVAPEVVAQP